MKEHSHVISFTAAKKKRKKRKESKEEGEEKKEWQTL